jgi:hypothetical protein
MGVEVGSGLIEKQDYRVVEEGMELYFRDFRRLWKKTTS